jgi:hypothetical protein
VCNIPLISGFIVAAQLLFAGSIVFFSAAGVANGNIFHFGDAPVAMGLGAAALTGTVASLVVAAAAAGSCASACPSQTAKLRADIAALITAIVLLGAAITATTILANAPFAALIPIAGILITLGLIALTFGTLTTDLVALSACAAAGTTLTTTGTVILILTIILIVGIGIAVIAGIAGGFIPLIPFPPR